jgi:predicted nucleic acid-binding protein
MTVFVDTSALYALLDGDDAGHGLVRPAWDRGIDDAEGFATTNYVLLETTTLAQARLGIDAVRVLISEMLPMIQPIWVTAADHAAGLEALLTAGRRRLSLVDCVSFAVMRSREIGLYLGLDPHFDEQGFRRYAPED